MNRTALLAQMHEYHQTIADITAQADAMVSLADIDAAAICSARWRFVRVLTGYQMFKHQQIFDPVMKHGSALDADAARQLKAECILISEAFRNYVAKWSTSGITGQEDTYRCEAHAIILRVRTHIAREARGIEALLSRSALTA